MPLAGEVASGVVASAGDDGILIIAGLIGMSRQCRWPTAHR